MNRILRILTFWPTFNNLLKGGMLYKENKYQAAIHRLDKCFKNPKFHNEMLCSYYGLSLFHLGQVEESKEFLQKAHDCFEAKNWQLENEHDFNLANEVVNALEDNSKNKVST
ncbi:MAG: hypothetical protein PHI97_09475 [Desulfobulbus sp.]|nr:hypothetical protein [Desulfobulbus sp.]